MAARGQADERGRLALPMGRCDMADYLGLTAETICRALAQLKRDGTIVLDRGSIVVRNRRALGAAGSTALH
jgi:CRP-like cAMP-binding protein